MRPAPSRFVCSAVLACLATMGAGAAEPTRAAPAAAVSLQAAPAGQPAVQAAAPVDAAAAPLALDGRSLELEQIVAVARQGRRVRATGQAWQQVARSHELLLAYARMGQPVYGLNRGVGQNKDQTIFEGDAVSAQARRLSEQFNRRMLLSHTVAYGEPAPGDAVRAAMLIRLNTALFGGTGMQPELVRQYERFLNLGITPVVLGQGSVGEADITILPQIGLAMMGEGKVEYRGRIVDAAEAMEQAGIAPVRPFAKDGLSILSANAYGAALAVLAAADAAALLDDADAVAALSLEGYNGNVAPLLEPTQSQRPYPAQRETAGRILHLLAGSALWQTDEKRGLQDPLSFRTVSQVHGAARAALQALREPLRIQVNSSDDNPTVALDARPPAGAQPQQQRYYVTQGPVRGAVLPSAGFDPTVWVVPLQGLGVALSHVAQSSAQRVLRLGDPAFTGLSRFLTPGDGVLAYTTIQKPVSALVTEVRALSQPVSSDALVVAGHIEDVATNAPLAAQRVGLQLRRLNTLLGIELMHAAQAVDLRLRAQPGRPLGRGTGALLREFRGAVPFLDQDRRLSEDIAAADRFLQQYPAAGR